MISKRSPARSVSTQTDRLGWIAGSLAAAGAEGSGAQDPLDLELGHLQRLQQLDELRQPRTERGERLRHVRDHPDPAVDQLFEEIEVFTGGRPHQGRPVTGAEAIECVHHVRDLHVTILRLLGLDDNKLTYFHGGRFKQLSQFGGKVIEELLA